MAHLRAVLKNRVKKRELLQAIVALIEVSDYGLLSQDAVLGEMADPSVFSRIRQIAGIVKRFYDEFDYTESMEYRASIEGKRAAYAEISRRMALMQRRPPRIARGRSF